MLFVGKIINKLREISHEDTGLGHFIRTCYMVLGHPLTNAFFTVLGPIIISIPISKQYFGILFWIPLIFFIVIVILIAAVQQYNRKKESNIKWFIKSIEGFAKIGRQLTAHTRKLTKYIFTTDKKSVSIRDIKEKNGLQNIAMSVCGILYEMIKSMDDKHSNISPYITVYAKFPKTGATDGSCICKMIAYENITHEEPTSYGYPYDVKDDTCYHSRIFNNKDLSIRILNGKQDIKDNFTFHEGATNREQEIEQYIGIPINVNEAGICILLQIDINIPNFFGDSKSTIEEFVRHIFLPYSHMLSVAYENERLYECTYKKWGKI